MSGERTGGGVVHRFGDGIDTDMLAPGRLMKRPIDDLAAACLEALDPGFATRVRPGDVIVAGGNFGTGSSREQAAQVLLTLGIAAVLARSFARIFYRNALNLGLPVLVCPAAVEIPSGIRLAVDPIAGRARELDGAGQDTGRSWTCEPLPDHLMTMIADGGLLPHLAKRLAKRA
ncbi:MAG TPA: 3-isopropylmalate dehydratase small subunit [Stellaceae bacterium]|nr:3-isopropylmalate dehydratase small subunit [Stellaceae bacterium]